MIILLILLLTSYFSRFLLRKNKLVGEIFLICSLSYLFTIILAIYGLGIKNFTVFPFLGGLFLEFFNQINNLLPFLLGLPILIIFYFLKIKTYAKFELTNLSIRNHYLLIDDKKKRYFKGLLILQIKNIPKGINVKEERTRKKILEKLTIPGNLHYLHYHLTSLAKNIPQFAYEIHVFRNDIQIRFILTTIGADVNEVMEELDNLKEILIVAFSTAFPGLKFELLKGPDLKNAWEDIFGGFGDYKFKITDKQFININKITDKLLISILKFENVPIFKLINKKSQIDALIRGLMGAQIDLSYIVSARSGKIYDFEKREEGEKRMFGRKLIPFNVINSNRGKYKNRKAFQEQLVQENIRKELLNIRHTEITGTWVVSGYITIRSNEKEKLNIDLKKVASLISTVFGINLFLLKSGDLEKAFSVIPMRECLSDPETLTSEQLAIYLHLPETPIPSLSRLDIPEFEIPPERKIAEGISIGRILLYDQELYPLKLSVEDLRLNTFICGLIGMGKSRLTMNLLTQLSVLHPEINWVCLDWKGEYTFLKSIIQSRNINVLTPGSEENPVFLNMFDPQGTNSDEHARKLFAIIREVFKSEFNKQSELSAQMESVCKEVIRRVVNNPKQRNLESFIQELKNYAREKISQNKTVLMTVTALINRFDKFRHGILARVLNVKKSNVNFQQLMEEKVIIDLNYLLQAGGAKEDVRLLMNLILKYVIDKALARGITNTLKHIVVIEDAQFLIPSVLREVPETSLVEDIPLLLRGVGESLITVATRPDISADIIANSAIKITFKSPYDSQKIAKYQNLTERQELYLRTLPKREAIVTLPNFQFPFRIYTDYFEYEKNTQPINDFQSSKSLQPVSTITDLSFINTIQERSATQKQHLTNYKMDGRQLIEKVVMRNDQIESKIFEVLKGGPKNKKMLSELLSIPKEELDEKLAEVIKTNRVLTLIAPIFKTKRKQKLYLLPKDRNHIKTLICNQLEKDFLIKNKIGKLSENDTFSYVWYGNNTFIKIFVPPYSELNLDEITKLLVNWFEEAVDRGSFELIVIVPFFDWAENLRNWLRKFQSIPILVFSYNTDDWKLLGNYLEKGISPHQQSVNNNMIIKKEKRKADLSLEAPSVQKKIHCAMKSKDKEVQDQWISEIIKKYQDKFRIEILKRFGENYPTATELAEEFGCSPQTVDFELKPIKKFLKSVEINDFFDPITFKHRYYGWKNENLGRNIMKRELCNLLETKNIQYSIITDENLMEALLIEKKIIYFIYDKSNFLAFWNNFQLIDNPDELILIIHTIELKDFCEKKIQREPTRYKIRLFLYDWVEVGPFIRELNLLSHPAHIKLDYST
ncbi:MAG: ATP-binding protein [Candidatus Helarchaeota archaeon]